MTVAALLATLTLTACNRNDSLKKLSIQKNNSSNPLTSLRVELAQTDESRQRGLMFRKNMPHQEGMLFVFDEDTDVPFWMKNTYIPLDILFIDANFQIVDIKENTHPMSEELIRPGAPYRLALEVNAGFVKENKIEAGDKVNF